MFRAGSSLRELVTAGPRTTVTDLHGTLTDLQACTEYIFAVAVLFPGGTWREVGPMSNKMTVR